MQRRIAHFRRDELGDWVAELSCGHNQHVRHQPPMQWREWVLDDEERHARLGSVMACPLCDRGELPADLRLIRATPAWTLRSVPEGLTRRHRVASGSWARLDVRRGELHFVAATEPPLDVLLIAGSTQAIPPDVDHHVELLDESVLFTLTFFAIDPARVVDGPR